MLYLSSLTDYSLPKWQPVSFSILLLSAAFLFASWLLPYSQEAWQAVDQWVFFSLNGRLSEPHFEAWLWAVASTRWADLVILAIMLATLVFPHYKFAPQPRQRLLFFIILLLFLVIIRYFFQKFAEYYQLSGDSPSLVLSPSYSLQHYFPELDPKDKSTHSFPSDHAAVLWAWAGYLIYCSRRWLSLLALGGVILLMLPRLTAGAHWFSDVMIGGSIVGLLALAIGLFTPLLNQPFRFLWPYFNKICNKIPFLKFFNLQEISHPPN